MKSLSYPHTHLRPSSRCSISEIIYRTPGFFEYLQGTGCDQFAVANSAHVDISCSTSTIITLKTVDLLADRRSFNKLDYRRSTTDTPAVYRISPIPRSTAAYKTSSRRLFSQEGSRSRVHIPAPFTATVA